MTSFEFVDNSITKIWEDPNVEVTTFAHDLKSMMWLLSDDKEFISQSLIMSARSMIYSHCSVGNYVPSSTGSSSDLEKFVDVVNHSLAFFKKVEELATFTASYEDWKNQFD